MGTGTQAEYHIKSMFALECCTEIRFGRLLLFGRDENKRGKLRDFALGFIREHRMSQQKQGIKVVVCDQIFREFQGISLCRIGQTVEHSKFKTTLPIAKAMY